MKILSKNKFIKIKTIYNENTILLSNECFEMHIEVFGSYYCAICKSLIFHKAVVEQIGNRNVIHNMNCYICKTQVNTYMYIDGVRFKIHKTISI